MLTNGNFDFKSVPTGDYQFRVTDLSGAALFEQVKSLRGKDDFVFLVIGDPKRELDARNTVSYSSLQHKVPRRAWDAFRAAQRAHALGDAEQAIQYLQEALLIDPDFSLAHSDLAAIYAHNGRIEEAFQHAETAFRLDPQLPEAGCNFALLLLTLKRYPEAEIAARHMLGGYYVSAMQGVLAVSLIAQRKDIDEALKHLEQAVAELPFVRLWAARSLGEIGRNDLAVIQVEDYLRLSAHDCERTSLEAWVASVRSQLLLDK